MAVDPISSVSGSQSTANAAAALLAADRVGTLAEGVARATQVLQSGRGKEVLARLIACSEPGP